MTSYPGDGDGRPPQPYEPDPALVGYPPPVWSPPPASYGVLAPPGRHRPVSALPDGPRLYHQMLRGPRHRWWRPVLALLLVIPIVLLLWALATVPVLLLGIIERAPNLGGYLNGAFNVNSLGPVGFLFLNLTLIALIPAAGLSIWIAHRIRPRYLASVAGGIRWRWLLRCALVVVPLWALYVGLGVLVAPAASPRPAHWLVLLVMVIVLTPLQAAGEEYFFRGWILQNIGSYFARPTVGLVISLVVSTAAFAAAHTSPDPWVLGTIGCLAVASGLAAWRTGGLEAGIVLHAVNNLLTFFAVIFFGGWDQAFVNTNTTGTPVMLLLALIVHGSALALIFWQARRTGIDRYFRPPTGDGPEAVAVVAEATWNPVAALNQTP
jgi:membrane protease YdiL (CAAX protease family)